MWNYNPFKGRNPCRNGEDCYYLKQKKCHFYHPPEHRRRVETDREQSPPFRQWARIQRQRIQISRIQTIVQMFSRLSISNERRTQRIIPRQLGRPETLTQANRRRMNQAEELIQKPLKQKTLPQEKRWFFNHNNEFKISKTMEQREKYDQCSICFSSYQEQDRVLELYCHHHYHKDCIQQWFACNEKCPLCKKDFRTHEQYRKFDPNFMKRITRNQEIYHQFLPMPPIEPIRPTQPINSSLFLNNSPRVYQYDPQEDYSDYVDHYQDQDNFQFDDFADFQNDY